MISIFYSKLNCSLQRINNKELYHPYKLMLKNITLFEDLHNIIQSLILKKDDNRMFIYTKSQSKFYSKV